MTGPVSGAVARPDQVDVAIAAYLAATYVWQSYTPTFANITQGAGGTIAGSYLQLPNLVVAKFSFVMGTGSAVGTGPTVTLPVAAHASLTNRLLPGILQLNDTGTGAFDGLMLWNGTVLQLFAQNSGGSYVTTAGITNLIPFTWTAANADFIEGVCIYRPA